MTATTSSFKNGTIVTSLLTTVGLGIVLGVPALTYAPVVVAGDELERGRPPITGGLPHGA